MNSIAIFLGFLVGTYGIGWCLVWIVAIWLSRGTPHDDVVLSPRWVLPVFVMVTFPVPLLLASGGAVALWWGVRGMAH